MRKLWGFSLRLFPVSVIICLVAGSVCCVRKELSTDHDVAHQLFEKSVRMIAVYIDSIGNAQDSASLQNIVNNFNIKITTLNFEFPPDTDLDLNEDENDSLIRMNKRLVRTIELKDSLIMHPCDSLKAALLQDSIAKKLVVRGVTPDRSDSIGKR